MAQQGKINMKRMVGNVFIAIGAVLIIGAVGYEAANYPWRILLEKFGMQISDELPDPAPLPEMVAPEGESGNADDDMLMQAAGMFAARPELNLQWVGVLQIPKIGISENIVEGTGHEMLYAVGHMRSTPLPGEGGNCVMAAHRDYVKMNPFRHLDKVKPGEKIRVRYGNNIYSYEVFKNFVVDPNETWVTHPQEDTPDMLTLITCTPVITSTHRMVVWAKLAEVHELPSVAK